MCAGTPAKAVCKGAGASVWTGAWALGSEAALPEQARTFLRVPTTIARQRQAELTRGGTGTGAGGRYARSAVRTVQFLLSSLHAVQKKLSLHAALGAPPRR